MDRNLDQPNRPRNLSGTYLDQALDALESAADPESLFGSARDLGRDSEQIETMLLMTGLFRRKGFCRTCVLFTALAAEAYINEHLAARLRGQPKKDREAIDRMSTVNKYVLGTRLATGKDLFPRNGVAAEVLADLFKLRHLLVHPKPGIGPGYGDDPERNFEPPVAAHFLVMVAGISIVLLRDVYGPKERDSSAELIWAGRRHVSEFARQASEMPNVHSPRQAPLIGQVLLKLHRDGLDPQSPKEDALREWRASSE